MIFDLEQIEHENSESMTKQFVSADSSWNLALKIAKSYSFKGLFVRSELAIVS